MNIMLNLGAFHDTIMFGGLDLGNFRMEART